MFSGHFDSWYPVSQAYHISGKFGGEKVLAN